MTLPAFKAAGAGSQTAPAWPTHVAGDFAILAAENPDHTQTTPSGWTRIGKQIVDSANLVRQDLFYRFATSSSESAPAMAGSANHNWSTICTYTGVNKANPIHAYSGIVSQTPVAPGLTTFLNDCLIVVVFSWGLNNVGPMASGESNATLGSLTERYDAGTAVGNGGGLVFEDGTMATAGYVGPTLITLAGFSCASCIALQAADKTFWAKSRIVNTGM